MSMHSPQPLPLRTSQRGATLLAFCRDRLEAVQEQVRVLDGGTLQPWTQE